LIYLAWKVKSLKAKSRDIPWTSLISTIAEYDWYKRVKSRDTAAKLTVTKIHLGRDLGAAIEIGPVMARKILKKNGSVT
jgi:hypothetical protein